MKELALRARSGVPSRASSASKKCEKYRTNNSNSSNVTDEPREKPKKERDYRKRSSTTDNDSPLPSKRRRQSQVPAETRNTSKDKLPINKSQPTRILTSPPASRLRPMSYSPSDPSDDNDGKEEETVQESQAMIVCTLEEELGASIDATQDLSRMKRERPRRKAARLSRERIQKAYSAPFGRGDDGPESRPKRGTAASPAAVAKDTTESKANNEEPRPSPDQQPRPADEVPQLHDGLPRCGNCSSTTHSLDRCLKATRGTISGCPLCRVPGHLLEDCEKFPLANADPSSIVRLVVWDRGNMPAWETKIPWFKYLYFYMGTFEFFLQDRKFVHSAPLPWTETYARAVAASASSAQQNNDDIGSNLSDPQTANLAAAWKTFANSNEYVWPFGPSTDPFRHTEA